MGKLRGFYSVEETKKILNDVGVELRVDLPENSLESFLREQFLIIKS